jgi:hypothetical protein
VGHEPVAAHARATHDRATPQPVDDTVPARHFAGLPSGPSGRTLTGRRSVPSRVHVLVLRMHWGGKPPKFPDTGQMKAMLATTGDFYRHASRGRQHLNGKVTPWLTVAGGFGNCSSQGGSVHHALAAAHAHGIGTGGFNRFMLVMPQCGTNSLGQLPGQVTWIREARPYPGVLEHELGHNLGLTHANSLICTADKRRVTQGGSCQSQEYGDMWDAMGLSSQQFSVAVLKRLGWAGKLATASSSGTWTLQDAAASGSGLQGLKVPSGKASYWVELRTDPHALASAYGSFPITGTPGVLIRLDTGEKSLRIVDAAPGNPDRFLSFPDPDLVNPALPPGSSFTTPQKIRITVVSQTSSTATVRVTRGKAASAPAAPSIASAVRDGGGVTLTGQPPDDNGQVLLGYLAQRSPGGSATYLRDPGGADHTLELGDQHQGAGTWTVRAVNQVGTGPASAPAAEHVAAPSVSISSPAPGASVGGPDIAVAVTAAPDALSGVPVDSVTVCTSGGECGSDSTAPYTVILTGVTSGAQELEATALDQHGDKGTSAKVSITVVDSPPTVHLDSPSTSITITSGDTVAVAASAVPNATTHRAVQSVSFTAYPVGQPDQIVANTFDDAAPFDGELTIFNDTADPVDYTISAVAYDGFYSSTPSTITIHVNPSPRWRPASLRPGPADGVLFLGG